MRIRLLAVGLVLVLMLGAFCSGPKPLNPNALAQEQACVENLQIGNYEAAKTRCELCLEYDETVPECINGLGIIAYANGDDATAIRNFQKAIKMSENFAQARNNLGAVYFKNSEFDEALPFFKAAVETDPGYEDARYNYALTYQRIGQRLLAKGDKKNARSNFELAIVQYNKLIAVNPRASKGYLGLGLIKTSLAAMETLEARQSEDIAAANSYYEKCLQVEATNELCHQSYGQVLLTQNQFDTALYHFVQCLAGNKNNPECIKGMDSAYQGSQIKGQALSQYIQRLKKNPNDAQGHYGYCTALFQTGMSQMAVAECQAALRIDPKQCLAYYQLAMYAKKILNSGEALSNCRSFILCDLNQKDQDKLSECQRIVTSLSGT